MRTDTAAAAGKLLRVRREFVTKLLTRKTAPKGAAMFVADWLAGGRPDAELLATLGVALLREDAEFHTFQMVEAGFRQYTDLRGTPDGAVVLVAIARYLAAHSPTARASGQTFQTALQLHSGALLFTD